MLSKLFPKNHARYTRSPVANWLNNFSAWLITTGYKGKPAQGHVYRLKQVLEGEGVISPATKFSKKTLSKMFEIRLKQQKSYCATLRLFQNFLSLNGQLIEEPSIGKYVNLVENYQLHLIDMRGFALSTIGQHLTTVNHFLQQIEVIGSSLQELSTPFVESFVTSEGERVKRQYLQHIIAHLRSFLRYCYDHHHISKRIDIIDTAIAYREELPPRALPWSQIQQLLRSIDRNSKAGLRDLTILHLMVYYGLRPSEIVTLSLHSIDWQTGLLHVYQCKTRSALVVPLMDHTLHLLKYYLHNGRPQSTHKELFLRARMPSGSLKHTAVCDIYQKRARESGLPLQGTSSYCLRHSFALRLLNQGVGIKAIGDLLGHHTLESTCVYLRLDMTALQDVPLPVPKPCTQHGGKSV